MRLQSTQWRHPTELVLKDRVAGMGVKHLWQLIEPVAVPVRLETLAGKRVAVDASIWLHQFLKSMRDKDGKAIHGAHIIGFFRRICKLLFFGIKPVFVFDGGAPELKRATLVNRRMKKAASEVSAKKAAALLAAAKLKIAALNEFEKREKEKKTRTVASEQDSLEINVSSEAVTELPHTVLYFGDDAPVLRNSRRAAAALHARPPGSSFGHGDEDDQVRNAQREIVDLLAASSTKKRKRTTDKRDEYELPDTPVATAVTASSNDPRLITESEMRDFINVHKSSVDLKTVDIDSLQFQALPLEVQHEIILELKTKSRQASAARLDVMLHDAKTSLDFSKLQIRNLIHRNSLTQRVSDFAKGSGGSVNGSGSSQSLHIGRKAVAQRIVSERQREFFLVKNDDGMVGGYTFKAAAVQKVVENGMVTQPSDGFRKNEQVIVLDDDDGSEFVSSDEEDGEFEEVKMDGDVVAEVLSEISCVKNEDFPPSSSTNSQAHAEHSAVSAVAFTTASEVILNFSQLAPTNLTQEYDAIKMKQVMETWDLDQVDKELSSVMKKREKLAEDKRGSQRDVELCFWQTFLLTVREWKHANDADPAAKSSSHTVNASQPTTMSTGSAQKAPAATNYSPPLLSPSQSLPKKMIQKKLAFTSLESFRAAKPTYAPIASTANIDTSNVLSLGKGSTLVGQPVMGRGSVFRDTWSDSDDDELDIALNKKFLSDVDTTRERNSSSCQDEDEDFTSFLERGSSDVDVVRVKRPLVFVDTDDDEATVVANGRRKQGNGVGALGKDEVEDAIMDLKDDGFMEAMAGATQHAFEDARGSPEVLNTANDDDGARGASSPDIWIEQPVALIVTPGATLDALVQPVTIVVDSPGSDKGEEELQPVKRPRFVVVDDRDHEDLITVAESKSRSDIADPVITEPTPLSQDVEEEDDENGIEIIDDEDELNDNDENATARRVDVPVSIDNETDEYARFVSSITGKTGTSGEERGVEDVRQELENELVTLNKARTKAERDADELTDSMVRDSQELLRLFGIPYIIAPLEAESQCAYLYTSSLVDGIITEDSDVFLFGGSNVYKNMFNQSKYVETYSLADIENGLRLDREGLIKIAYLLGSDYTEGIPGVGAVTAMEILNEFSSEDGLTEFREWWADVIASGNKRMQHVTEFRRKFAKKCKRIDLPPHFPDPRVRDAYLQPTIDEDKTQFVWGMIDHVGLQEFLFEKISWDVSKTDEVLVPVLKQLQRVRKEGGQTMLDRFFNVAAKDPAKVTHRSDRINKVLDSIRSGKRSAGAKRKTDGDGKSSARKSTTTRVQKSRSSKKPRNPSSKEAPTVKASYPPSKKGKDDAASTTTSGSNSD
ncbi:hypothetical protein SeLEV6574_g00993 [Synchytrium endobioticum]|uniref:Uncharacterized protein n=1 Tax=Synchytrium endobioticum TaxID=286115 RepID=A0A507DH96_9FUNG|nr:hypothetical protein SeLEV6574_g00993 [Synchytrium endobioticum]